jgi:hypothetical protein
VSRAPSRSSESEGWSGGPAPYGSGPPALDVHHGDLLPIPQLGARPPHVELTQGPFATEARRDLRQAGWVHNLARLASHLAPHFREPHGLAGPYRTLRGDGPWTVSGRCGLEMLSCEAVAVVLTSVSPARWSRS